MAVYSKIEDLSQIIKRCENHQKKRQFEIDDSSSNFISHLVRCKHPQVIYYEDIQSQRQSVTIPYIKSQGYIIDS
jgi:hypothetical protein